MDILCKKKYTRKVFAIFSLSLLIGQYDYSLVDLNPSSNSYSDSVGASYFNGSITLHYFGGFTWGTCTARFEQLNELHNNLTSEGLPVQLVGIGKDSHISGLSNWTSGNNAPVCADESPFPTWSNWSASQRDLFVLDAEGTLLLRQNITSGIPDDLENLIYTSLENDDLISPPTFFKLSQNYPNPFNPYTTISYNLTSKSHVSLTVYDLSGNRIINLVNQNQVSGHKNIIWNAKDYAGRPVSAGMYLYAIIAGEFKQTKKMILLK